MVAASTTNLGYVISAADEGEQRWFAGGGMHQWKARSTDTGGAFHAFVDYLTHGKMTPLHRHPNSDDSMYVIDGAILYHVADENHVLGPGSFVSALRGTPHAFMVISDTATVFAFQTPGAGESFYLDASDALDGANGSDRAPDLPRLQSTAAAHPEAVEILGPPPFTKQ